MNIYIYKSVLNSETLCGDNREGEEEKRIIESE
jgi:hypothetical protein